MKFTVNKKDIAEAVSNIQRAVSTKTSIPALEGILLTAQDTTLELCAYDMELGITTVIPAQVSESGKSVLSAKIFSDIVRRSPAETLTIAVDEKNMATLESGYSRFTIIGIPAAEFPELPRLSDATQITLPANLLKSMIRQTLFAVAESDAKPIHQGSLFNLEQGMLDVVSVDGYRLAVRSEPVDYPDELSFVVPGKTLGEILKLLKDTDDPVELAAGRRHILFTIDNYTVISSLLEGEFLNYKAAIPPESQTEVILKTREAIDSVERVSLLITDRLKSPVRCLFADNEVKLNCTTSMGRASDQIDVEMTGQSVEIGFNNRYLLEALRNTECDEVKVQLGGPLSPMKVVPKEGNSFLFLVLPVRLKSE
ncbi:MAG TPA: DNA polymerase III subunit beta [Candidatus Acutalibacter pullicola]|uniref:Beta sliding clamp n=1 Tax=Candidatus Acutalibacter pullicola TaxID=2838417 RepID=A0A9D2MWZ6_9FIRM|nr:DNA polymerase III subunit beta [Candidatus Acutalibacter pullicola]